MQSREVAIERIDEEPDDASATMSSSRRRCRSARAARRSRRSCARRATISSSRAGCSTPRASAGEPVQIDEDAVEVDVDPAAFAARGLLASAACGVCGRVAIADLELRAKEVTAETRIDARGARDAAGPAPPRRRSSATTGGLHAAGLFTAAGEPLVVREDVGRHNAVDKVVGHALATGLHPAVLVLSGRAGYELLQKAIMAGVPVVASVSAPSSLAIELAERFGVALAGFVRGTGANVYSHGWRID